MDLTAIATPPSEGEQRVPAVAHSPSEELKEEKKKKKKKKSHRSVIKQTDPPLQPVSPSPSREGVASDMRVVLNVGGRRFETLTSTLCKYPHSLLGTMFDPRNAALLKPDERGEVRRSAYASASHRTPVFLRPQPKRLRGDPRLLPQRRVLRARRRSVRPI